MQIFRKKKGLTHVGLHNQHNPFPNKPCFFFKCLQNKSFENTVGKEEIARKEQFLFSPPVFLYPFVPFLVYLKLSSANSFNLEQSKICCLGKG